ncbi:hypothetical protein GGR54DRAFT_541197 [Hypoxylon sp. NC1633]|nr:hypothetical protein GGR54DRAFT_541197 [Hypoxylon sp. NC1633]
MSTNSGSIRDSMLRHWRNTSISLSRSGSKREKGDNKASKRLSFHALTAANNSDVKSPESPREEAIAMKSEPEQSDIDGETTSHVAPPPNGISLHVTVHIAPENVERFLAAFKDIFDLVSAEPECSFFEVYKSVEEPGKISWVENWSKDRQWLIETQLTKAYYKEYFEITEPMFLKPREARLLEPVGPGFTVVKGLRL